MLYAYYYYTPMFTYYNSLKSLNNPLNFSTKLPAILIKFFDYLLFTYNYSKDFTDDIEIIKLFNLTKLVSNS